VLKRSLLVVSLLLSLALGCLAQNVSVAAAQDLANRLAGLQELPTNVRLRFQVLGARMGDFQGRQAPADLLRFFSDTRVMVWNRPVSPTTEQTMRGLESQMVGLARQKGYNLDLPPVGYAPVGSGHLIQPNRLTFEGVLGVAQETERQATNVLANHNSAELLFLRDNLARFRTDLADGDVASDMVRGVLGARARFLTSDSAQIDLGLLEQLTVLGEVIRSAFPVQRLRESRGQILTI
jgi:hypothetical protein